MASQDDLLDFIDTRPELVKRESEAIFKGPVERFSPKKTPVKETPKAAPNKVATPVKETLKATPSKIATPVKGGAKQTNLFNFVKKREEKKEDKALISS